MASRQAFELAFLLLVLALALAGFSGIYVGGHARPDGFQHLHVASSIAWLGLLSVQWWVVRQRRFQLHRTIGVAIYAAAPLLVGTLVLLTIHSAAKDAAAGRADFMVVPNLMVTLEVALLLFLAILLRHQREIHGALMMGTALQFMGIALFFTLVGHVPGFTGSGDGSPPRFAQAAGVATGAVGLVGLGFFLANRRIGWPWLLAGSFFFINGLLQAAVADAGGARTLTALVASIDRAPGFVLATLGFAIALDVARRRTTTRRASTPAGSAVT